MTVLVRADKSQPYGMPGPTGGEDTEACVHMDGGVDRDGPDEPVDADQQLERPVCAHSHDPQVRTMTAVARQRGDDNRHVGAHDGMADDALEVLHRLAVSPGDDIPGGKPGFVRRATQLNFGHTGRWLETAIWRPNNAALICVRLCLKR